MVVFPHAKINLGLYILEKRSDGYHNLSSCLYPIPWCDILEIVKSNKTTFSTSGISIPGDESENLCIYAYELLRDDFDISEVSIHLHKIIPIGAGLGGGSSDGAFTLRCLNQLFGLNQSPESLQKYAGKLGSDCSFFLYQQPFLISGKGDVIQEMSISMKNKSLVVVYPGIHVDTSAAYASVMPKFKASNLNQILTDSSINQWKNHLLNDFEELIFKKHAALETVKNTLYQKGAVYASMSGSGSAFYGIFEHPPDLSGVFPQEYTVWQSVL